MKRIINTTIIFFTLNIVFAQNIKQSTIELLDDTIHLSITVAQADSLINANTNDTNFYILDVRTPAEYLFGHIHNANNIDFYSSNFNVLISNLDRNKTYLVYCKSGGRSIQAFNLMISLQFKVVYNMLGGIDQWIFDGYPVDTGSTSEVNKLSDFYSSVNIYPNPANNNITINTSQYKDEIMYIYNIQGQLLLQQSLLQENTKTDISTFANGLYLVELRSSKYNKLVKLIKQ